MWGAGRVLSLGKSRGHQEQNLLERARREGAGARVSGPRQRPQLLLSSGNKMLLSASKKSQPASTHSGKNNLIPRKRERTARCRISEPGASRSGERMTSPVALPVAQLVARSLLF